jgi:prevent-host-death family protein
MKEIPVTKFKANCSSLIEQVRRTKRPIRITRRGKALAEITPVASGKGVYRLGKMKGTAKIVGDIVSPVIDLNDIEALKD